MLASSANKPQNLYVQRRGSASAYSTFELGKDRALHPCAGRTLVGRLPIKLWPVKRFWAQIYRDRASVAGNNRGLLHQVPTDDSPQLSRGS